MRRRCPECGQPVKEENLGEHMARAHPSVSRRRYREMDIRAPRTRRMPAFWVPIVAGVVIVALAAGFLFAAKLGEPPGPSYAGRFGADHTYWDFGDVPQTVVSHSFTFENDGVGDLVLSGAWTSCGCTSARIVIGGVESPKFGMHNNPSWTGRVPALGTATITVEYDALTHTDYYVGERSVFLRTDDPAQPEVEFRIAVREV
jgi:hypothetical protein